MVTRRYGNSEPKSIVQSLAGRSFLTASQDLLSLSPKTTTLLAQCKTDEM